MVECSKITLFFIYFTLLQHLSSQSVSNALFSSGLRFYCELSGNGYMIYLGR